MTFRKGHYHSAMLLRYHSNRNFGPTLLADHDHSKNQEERERVPEKPVSKFIKSRLGPRALFLDCHALF